ncbi:MAG: hypothetical protein ABFD69_07080 [Candidatus Sumerlaeia bacterium]
MSFLRIAKQLLIATATMAMTTAGAWAGPGESLAAKSIGPAKRLTSGTAFVERIGRIYVKQPGMFATAKGGDWRLGNENVTFTFAGVQDLPTTYSMSIGPYEENMRPHDRIPGALIDISGEGMTGDFMGYFTQAIGLDPTGLTLKYDTAEPVSGPDGVGLKLTGSPFENRLLRIETTYWLAAGSRRLGIETRITDLEPGERIPELVDLADWGVATPIVKDLGKPRFGKPTETATDYLTCEEAGLGIAMALRSGRMHGTFQGGPANLSRTFASRAVAVTSGTLKAAVHETTTTTFQRDIWVVPGRSAEALAAMCADRKIPTGTISGTIHHPGIKKFENATVQILGYEYKNLKSPQTLLVVKSVDEKGSFTVTLPANQWYFVRGDIRGASRLDVNRPSVQVLPGGKSTYNIPMDRRTTIRVQVFDAATSKPVPAWIQLEAIRPTPPMYFGFPQSAGGYINYAFIPAEGKTFPVSEGHWKIHATHGIEYESGIADVMLERGKQAEAKISLTHSNPTTGWLGLQIGSRTTATPGVSITPEDTVLMAAAEGLDWIVTADFERATDLAPVIRKLGLEKELRASVGFSTLLPARPEWGHFLVYPLTKEHPDPAKASTQWADAKTANEFFATLRRLYPGALIHCEMPLDLSLTPSAAGGIGFLAVTGVHPLEVAYNGSPRVDFGFDAISLVPSRSYAPWDFNIASILWYALWRGGHGYPVAARPSSSFVYGSEPGYPRVLVQTGQDEPAKVSEKAFFDAFRKMHTQLTNAPFIEMKAGDIKPGEVMKLDASKVISLRVSAASWADVKRLQLTKDGSSEVSILGLTEIGSAQRFPAIKTGRWQEYKLKALKLRDFKDTLIGLNVMGENPLDQIVPRYSAHQFPFAIISPIIIDANGNGKYDRLKNYGDGGR